MASNLQSPGVLVQERDASATVVGASTSVGGTVGVFQWGPVMVPMLIKDEAQLVSVFGKPDDNTFGSFFTAANFLSYSRSLWVTRAATGNLNGTASGTGLLIKNDDEYEASYAAGQASVGITASRYPGTMGNGLIISIADSATFAAWAYKDLFSAAPGTSSYAAAKGGSNDELHVVVIDGAGKFSGTPGSTLEKFAFVSKGSDAISYQGLTNYYANVIRNQSQYIYWMDHPTGGTNWGNTVVGTNFTTLVDTVAPEYDFTFTHAGGTDDNAPTLGELQLAWDIYNNVETYDISLFPTGNASQTLIAYVAGIMASRKDAVGFGSFVNAAGGPIFGTSATRITDSTAYMTAVGDSNYMVHDSGYKYQYDKYNDKYRWVALNGDIAGLCARVDSQQDTWISPGGFTKGQIKNVVKLSWNPNNTERDAIYKISINPVVTFAGQGTILYGDKTGTQKPSAFDRINVRRLFLVLEKSIARSAKYQLFEINDEITRQQFIASVEPYLRDVQGRRGIEAFQVIADKSNNTETVIAANEFRGTILVKPARSINFIVLTFTAVGPNVEFSVAATV
jgi:hypothetical protein